MIDRLRQVLNMSKADGYTIGDVLSNRGHWNR